MNAHEEIKNAKLIFWDFDGVIKDSVDVKTKAFMQLFESYGSTIVEKVKIHHEANGGMSRYKKIPLYMDWAEEPYDQDLLDCLYSKFSDLVLNSVIASPWVPGAEQYIRENTCQQDYVLVSATPDDELCIILEELDIYKHFSGIFGASLSKKNAIKKVLKERNIKSLDCIMVGDATADMEAAKENKVKFVLRKHSSNADVFNNSDVLTIENFNTL